MQRSVKEILKGSFIGIVGKILGAAMNFFSLPMLLLLYGKPNVGLVGLALSANAFMQIMHMGVPTGAVKNFSEWIESKDFVSLKRGIQSNQFFFTVIGLVNSIILFYIGYNCSDYFQVAEPLILSRLFYILSITSFINWYFMGIQHLLLAHEKIGFVNLSTSLISILNFGAVVFAYFYDASIVLYFLVYSMTNIIVIPLNIYVSRRLKILKADYFIPVFWTREFKIIVGYSVGLFAMGLIQYAANQSQPLILGSLSKNGDTAVADYRILQNITMMISLMGGIFLQNFMPYISKVSFRGDLEAIKSFVFSSTKWISIFIFYICFLVAFNSDRILALYVKEQGYGLEKWLTIWVIGLLFLNNQGISSLILSIGKFRPIIIGLSVASLAAISFSIWKVDALGVGVASVSFLIYKSLEAVFIYGYYLPKVGSISSFKLIKSTMLLPLCSSIVCVYVSKMVCGLFTLGNLQFLLATGLLSLGIYIPLLWLFVLSDNEKNITKRIPVLKNLL